MYIYMCVYIYIYHYIFVSFPTFLSSFGARKTSPHPPMASRCRLRRSSHLAVRKVHHVAGARAHRAGLGTHGDIMVICLWNISNIITS